MSIPPLSQVNFLCNDSGGGGGGPEDCDDTILADSRIPTNGCLDHIEDSYYTGSYSPVAVLNGQRATGCVNGDIQRFIYPINTNILVRSGIFVTEDTYCPMAGMSIWFGNVTGEDPGAAGNPIDFEGTISLESAPIGSPKIGFAFNVVPGSTVDNFTGKALLIDYSLNRTQIVDFVNQDLRNPTYTVIRESTTMPDFSQGPLAMFIANYPSVNYFQVNFYPRHGFGDLDVWNDGSGYVSENTEIGAGFIWIGNATPGIHTIVMQHDQPDGDENFNFWPSA